MMKYTTILCVLAAAAFVAEANWLEELTKTRAGPNTLGTVGKNLKDRFKGLRGDLGEINKDEMVGAVLDYSTGLKTNNKKMNDWAALREKEQEELTKTGADALDKTENLGRDGKKFEVCWEEFDKKMQELDEYDWEGKKDALESYWKCTKSELDIDQKWDWDEIINKKDCLTKCLSWN